jgi:hypothetical protein
MKLQRTTWILIIAALLMGGFVYFYEIQGAPKREAAKATKRPIFTFAEDQIQSLRIETEQETLEIEQVEEEPVSWELESPETAPASSAAVAYLTNLLAEGESDRTLTVAADDLEEYGLDNPLATVEVQLQDGETHRIILGSPGFDRTFLYAQIDPPEQTSEQVDVQLVPIEFENAVSRPLEEWKQVEVNEQEEPEATDESESEPSDEPDTQEEPEASGEEDAEAEPETFAPDSNE